LALLSKEGNGYNLLLPSAGVMLENRLWQNIPFCLSWKGRRAHILNFISNFFYVVGLKQ
jgi:hypothetical protein